MVFFAVLIGVTSLNDLAPPRLALTQARSCATDMKAVMDGMSVLRTHARSWRLCPRRSGRSIA